MDEEHKRKTQARPPEYGEATGVGPALQMSVLIQPENNAECAAMYALDQVMDWLDKQKGWDAAKPRIAQWFHAKYGQG